MDGNQVFSMPRYMLDAFGSMPGRARAWQQLGAALQLLSALRGLGCFRRLIFHQQSSQLCADEVADFGGSAV